MTQRQLPRALRDARKRRSYTLARVAGISGLNLSQISLIETGGVDPRLSSIEALAAALDLTVTLVPRDAMPAVEAMLRDNAYAPVAAQAAEAPAMVATLTRVAEPVAAG